MAKPRIIGGVAKGRALDTPPQGTRPSPARLREALFDILAFEPRRRFLDLYAGSGAVGLEAASRGFHAVCVELAKPAAAVMRRNAASLGLPVEVVPGGAGLSPTSSPSGRGAASSPPPPGRARWAPRRRAAASRPCAWSSPSPPRP